MKYIDFLLEEEGDVMSLRDLVDSVDWFQATVQGQTQ